MRFKVWCLVAILAVCSVGNANALTEVEPVLETPARLGDIEGNDNDPDDPAIWIHPKDRSKSLVICTLKEGGMDVYDLEGVRIQHVTPKPVPGVASNPGRFNNVDIVFAGKNTWMKNDLAVVADRYNDMLRIFKISRSRLDRGMDPLVEITAKNQATIFNNNPEEVAEGDFTTYGLGVAQPSGRFGKTFVYVSQNDRTTLAKLVLVPMPNGKVAYKVVAKHNLPESYQLPDGTVWDAAQDDDCEDSHVEGIVVDDENGFVYFGQEQVGIWKGPIKNTFANLTLIDKVNEYGVPYLRTWNEEEEEYDIDLLWDQDKDYGSDYLAEDVEGLTIYDAGNGEGYLIASSQGSDQFVVYDRKTNAYIGNFEVVENQDEEIDGAQESDGAAVTNLNLGGEFATGLLVVQDGENTPEILDEEGEGIDNANFKYVPWGEIAQKMGLTVNNR